MNAPARECPACGAGRTERLFHQQFARIEGVSILDGYDVVACTACGMTFADRIPEQEAFDAYYRNASKYTFAQRAGAESPHDAVRLAAIADTIARLVPDRAARVLDVGCATGRLLAELRGRGFGRVRGVDPSPACVEAAGQLFGVDASVGTIASVGAEPRSYDLIIAVGVIEHLRDVQHLLGLLRSRLAPGGQLYAEVPDATGFGRWPNAPFQEFSVEHVNYFSPTSIRTSLAHAGLMCDWTEQNSRDQSEGTTVSNLSVLARVADESRALGTHARDEESRAALERYVAQSGRDEKSIRARIDALVASGNPIIIWGTGTQTLRLLAASDLASANIVSFTDSNTQYHDSQLAGRKIVPPSELRHLPHDIVVLSRVFAGEIKAQIVSELRLVNRVVVLN